MLNHEYIRQLPIESLAEILVTSQEFNEGVETYDDEWIDDYVTYYYAADGSTFYSFGDAVEANIKWLSSERGEKNDTV